MSSKRLSLAAQLAELNQPAPVDLDPEDAAVVGARTEDEEPSNAGREHYIEVGPSALRKIHDSVSDPKYDGVRISRTELENSDSDHTNAESSDDVPDPALTPVTSEDEESQHEDAIDEDSEQPPVLTRHRQAVQSALLNSGPAPHPQPEDELSSALKRTREEERKKGKAVSRQMAMYDSLLDARIRLQKCVSSMNRLPNAMQIPDYFVESETKTAADAMLSEALLLADDLFDLQEKLMLSNESIEPPARKRQKIADEETPVERDWEEELQELSKHSAELESTFHPHLLATLKKWSNKVLAIAPNALLPSNHTKFSKTSANQVKSAVQLVDEALLDRTSLLARTQLWRGTPDRLGVSPRKDGDGGGLEGDEADAHDVFDDTDFYQSLLRDVIDARSGASGGSGLDTLTADWRLAQKQRKKAKAASVDTRASKGRKLRFEVHEKLRNFMAPAPPQPLSLTFAGYGHGAGGGGAVWHEAQVDELFAGLLGRAFGGEGDVEAEAGGEDGDEPGARRMEVDVEQVVRGGFRVFG